MRGWVGVAVLAGVVAGGAWMLRDDESLGGETAEQSPRTVAECVRLRCPHLRSEATLAAQENGAALFDPLVALLATATEPGQAGSRHAARHLAGRHQPLSSMEHGLLRGGLLQQGLLQIGRRGRVQQSASQGLIEGL